MFYIKPLKCSPVEELKSMIVKIQLNLRKPKNTLWTCHFMISTFFPVIFVSCIVFIVCIIDSFCFWSSIAIRVSSAIFHTEWLLHSDRKLPSLSPDYPINSDLSHHIMWLNHLRHSSNSVATNQHLLIMFK